MNILVAVTGSISAYKAPDIVRGLINRGHTVRVILSKGALEFVNPNVFKYIGADHFFVPEDDFNYSGVLHISLSKWLDTFVLCPASANTLSDLAHGKCSDLLTSVFLSLSNEKVKVIFPAMNSYMLTNPITVQNIEKLKCLQNIHFIKPDEGKLVCGDTGLGKLPKVEAICELIPLYTNKPKKDKRVVITAGATISNIDDVRFVTNPAKGGTAYLIAKKFLSEGYQVCVIKGPTVIPEFAYLEKHENYKFNNVITTQELLETVQFIFKNNYINYYVSPMAVSDLEFEYTEGKMKKSKMNGTFKYKQAPDVLKWVVDYKERKTNLKIVGFAAEADLSQKVLDEKLARKPVDLLVANKVNSGLTGSKKQGFGTRVGDYIFCNQYPNNPGVYSFDIENNVHKEDIANEIFSRITKGEV